MSLDLVALCDSMTMHNLFVEQECYIEDRMGDYLEKNPATDMWLQQIIASEPFPLGQGYTMSKYVFHSAPAPQVETSELFAPIGPSNDAVGTNPADPDYVAANDACVTNCTTVDHGIELKQWSMQKACISTAWLCVMDVIMKWGFKQTLDAWAVNLARISRTVKAQWNRDKTIEHSQVVAAHPEVQNSINMFATKGVLPRIPAGGVCKPNMKYLERLYDSLARQYPQTAVARSSGGAPIFAVCCGRELMWTFARADATKREDDRWGDPTFYREGFLRGEWMYHGFMFLVDVEAPRFVEDPDRAGYFKRVWPYEQSATTIGNRWDSFAGGAYDLAPYELLLFLPRDQFTNVPFQFNKNPGGGSSFKEQDFTGIVKWQQFASPSCEDEDGAKGRWRWKYIAGTKPGDHEFGLGIIFRRQDHEDELRLMCSDTGLCDPCAGDVTIPADASLECAAVDGEPNQLSITAADLGISAPSNGDTIYVTFDSGVEEAAEVISFESTGDETVVLEFTHAIDCDYEGGVASLDTGTSCIGVEANYFNDSPNGSGKKVLRVTLVSGAVLPNTAAAATYTATFGDGTTGTATLLGTDGGDTSIVIDGETNYFLEFSSSFASTNGLDSITALDGIVCLAIA